MGFASLLWMRQTADENINDVVKNMGNFYSKELSERGIRFHAIKKVKEEYYERL